MSYNYSFSRRVLLMGLACVTFSLTQCSRVHFSHSALLKRGENVTFESEWLFQPELFSRYHQNLQDFIMHDPTYRFASDPDAASFAQSIAGYVPAGAKENRAFFQTFLNRLRSFIREGASGAFVDRAVLWMFRSNEMWDAFYCPTINYRTDKTYSLDATLAALEEAYAATECNPRYNGRKKPDFHADDLHFHGNIPFPLFSLSSGAALLRLPNVTRERDGEMEITEEFLRYIKIAAKNDKKHLYINLMHREKDSEQYKRVMALHQIENDPVYRDHLMVMTLDMNSDFYWQKGQFENLNDAGRFKALFLLRLNDGEGYLMSSKLKQSGWHSYVEMLLDEIHRCHFSGKHLLSRQERQVFIEITHLEMIKSLVSIARIDTFNLTCKHTIDRGATLSALLYLDHLLQNQSELTEEQLWRFIALQTEVPLVLHNRPAHRYRIERVIQTAKVKCGHSLYTNRWPHDLSK